MTVRNVFRSWPFRIAMLFIGHMSAMSVAYAFNRSVRAYLSAAAPGFYKMQPFSAALLFAVAIALFVCSAWKSAGGKRPRFWQRLDLSLLFLFTGIIIFICVRFVMMVHRLLPFDSMAVIILFGSAAAYAAAVAFIYETLVRLRTKTLESSFIWLRFCKQFLPKHPLGVLLPVLLVRELFYIAPQTAQLALSSPVFGQSYLTAVRVFPDWLPCTISLCAAAALTVICAFILSLSTEYEKANTEKIRSEQFKAELITNVSHDIRTPLTAMIGYVDLLKGLPINDDTYREYTGVLSRKAARLKTLIDDLMEASKAGTGNMAVHLQSISLPEIVGQIAGEFDDAFRERDLTLVLRTTDEPCVVQADNLQLWRALENLFGNAAKYALPNTRVFAELHEQVGSVLFSLKNTSAIPIDAEADALTEQFIRGDRARHTDGNGLGLYIAKSLVELVGGTLTVRVSGDLFEAEIRLPR